MTRANYYSDKRQRPDPKPIDDLIGTIVEQAGASPDLGIARLVSSWDDVVSERWRGRSRPVGVREQTLLVEVPEGADASLLRYDSADLVRRISQRFGPDLVRAVKFRVEGDARGGKS
jgi:predicted nucleic acid-binding Zn ribbon protein